MQIGIALMQKGEPMRAIDADELWNELGILYEHNKGKVNWNDALLEIKNAPTIEPEQREIPVTKEQILQAGYEGREVRFHIDGRLFAIRELAQ